MKKILNRMAKIGLEIVMYLFEHIFLVIGIAILINESGELTGDYISVEQLKKFYNHEATVTRDEIGKQKE